MGDILIAKVYGVEVDRKKVNKADDLTVFLYKNLDLKYRIKKEFFDGLQIEVKERAK